MIEHIFKINNWTVYGFYAVDCFCLDTIMSRLQEIKSTYEGAKAAHDTISNGDFNFGFTYSNLLLNKSVLVIGKATSSGEFINTLTHEARHLQEHIAMANNLNSNSEDVCYLLGNICLTIYEKCNEYISLNFN